MPSICGLKPDYNRMLAVLNGSKADIAPLYEFFSDINVQLAALEGFEQTDILPQGGDEWLDKHIFAQYSLGYDYLSPAVSFGFPRAPKIKTTDSMGNLREFQNDRNPVIYDRESFEKAAWPLPQDVDYSSLEYCAKNLPDGMKCVVNLGGGLLEWGMWLMGAELFCTMIYDDIQLVKDLLDKINEHQTIVAAEAASHPEVIAVAIGDDFGFKTQTFLPPKYMKELIYPGLRRLTDAAHKKGKKFILHTCGNVAEAMDDLIDFVKIDAKHSFEDVIMPITQAKKLWGHRVALLGGVDVDFLCRAEEQELRKYVANIVKECGDGGFAIGSGNSIANFVPPKSLRIMCETAILCQIS